ncbi:hypothetical protein WDV86_06205 [Pseudokineococcus sp. 1T1Z-3]|uniref:hypothetical protein n=1 Tax=Pseudokineococcus sp. 1T1Z-3 TaxID=3132745 RepID=UPI00309E87A9
MAYDVPSAGGEQPVATTTRQYGTTHTTSTFFVSLRGASLEEVTPAWSALAEGATVTEPLAASACSPAFGMLTDRFGVTWVVDAATP